MPEKATGIQTSFTFCSAQTAAPQPFGGGIGRGKLKIAQPAFDFLLVKSKRQFPINRSFIVQVNAALQIIHCHIRQLAPQLNNLSFAQRFPAKRVLKSLACDDLFHQGVAFLVIICKPDRGFLVDKLILLLQIILDYLPNHSRSCQKGKQKGNEKDGQVEYDGFFLNSP